MTQNISNDAASSIVIRCIFESGQSGMRIDMQNHHPGLPPRTAWATCVLALACPRLADGLGCIRAL